MKKTAALSLALFALAVAGISLCRKFWQPKPKLKLESVYAPNEEEAGVFLRCLLTNGTSAEYTLRNGNTGKPFAKIQTAGGLEQPAAATEYPDWHDNLSFFAARKTVLRPNTELRLNVLFPFRDGAYLSEPFKVGIRVMRNSNQEESFVWSEMFGR